MSLESRIRQLEEQTQPADEHGAHVIIYQPGDVLPPFPDDGRARVYIPDNGRGPSGATQCY
jgi:hypothetical protein